MRKLVLAGLLVLGGVNLMAKQCYTMTEATCKHSNWDNKAGFTQFFILGHYQEKDSCGDRYHVGIENAASSYLRSEYAGKIERYCKAEYTLNIGVAFQYSKKSKANKQLSESLNDCMRSDTYRKCIKIRGWNVDDWDD